MAIYSFSCETCGYEFDKRIQSLVAFAACPVCGGEAPRHSVYKPNFRMGRASPPKGDPERIDYDRKELRKRGWDGDRAVEATRKGMEEGEKGTYKWNPQKAMEAGA